jgi:arylsulfatase A-like enzyme
MLLFSFVGLSLLRFDADKLLELLFQLPPRTPRKDELIPPGCPFASARRRAADFRPAEFRRNGYKTAAIGKWHLGEDVGQGRDWDYSVLWDRCGPDYNKSAYYYKTLVRYNGGERVPLNGYSTDRYTEIAVDYIRDEATNDDKPWFLWLCYGGVHGPYTEADRHQQLYDDAPPTEVPVDIFGPRPTKPKHLVNYTKWKKDAQGAPIGFDARVKKYNRAVAALDEGVGRLVEVLKSSGELDNTLIVYTSDQGYAWGQHGCSEKWMAYDANIAAPLIFSWPEKIDAGQVCDEPVTGLDIVSTFHSLAGVTPVIELHGRDLARLLEDPTQTLEDPLLLTHTARVYGERFLNDIEQGTFVGQGVKPAYIMMRDGRYKYIRHMQADTIEEAYNLQEDPLELTNLAVDPNFASRLKRLREEAAHEVRQKNGEFVDCLPAPHVHQTERPR